MGDVALLQLYSNSPQLYCLFYSPNQYTLCVQRDMKPLNIYALVQVMEKEQGGGVSARRRKSLESELQVQFTL